MSKAAMKQMGDEIQSKLPSDIGYVLLTFPFSNGKGIANYITNADRKDLIKFLRETADSWEKNEVFDTPENNMY